MGDEESVQVLTWFAVQDIAETCRQTEELRRDSQGVEERKYWQRNMRFVVRSKLEYQLPKIL